MARVTVPAASEAVRAGAISSVMSLTLLTLSFRQLQLCRLGIVVSVDTYTSASGAVTGLAVDDDDEEEAVPAPARVTPGSVTNTDTDTHTHIRSTGCD